MKNDQTSNERKVAEMKKVILYEEDLREGEFHAI